MCSRGGDGAVIPKRKTWLLLKSFESLHLFMFCLISILYAIDAISIKNHYRRRPRPRSLRLILPPPPLTLHLVRSLRIVPR